jgi:septum site-determining protein MinC
MNNIIMLEQNLIDLSIVNTQNEMLIELVNIVETNTLKDKKIRIILGDVALSSTHVFGLKSIVEGCGGTVEKIYTSSSATEAAAREAGLICSRENPYEELEKKEQAKSAHNEKESSKKEIIEKYSTEKVPEPSMKTQIFESVKVEKSTDTRTKTLYLKQNFRSGQTASFDGNLVIIGDCHSGSEIIASGDITVWGILSGIAHAGVNGNENVSIRALKINAIQLRIATFFARKPDKLEVEKVEKTDSFIPEEAKVVNGDIVIYALNSQE